MRRGLLAIGVTAAIAAAPSAAAGPSQVGPPRVCEGLTICIPVGGPWVVVPGPARGARIASTVWQLRCPASLGIVGGVDVRVANAWIDVFFPGRIGSPINPGVTTASSVVFTALSVGPPGRSSSFLPVIGCIPSQGGQRVPSSVAAPTEYRPGSTLVRRVRVLEVRRGRTATATFSCRVGERLISVQVATGLFTAVAPTRPQLRSVQVTRSIRDERIVVSATRRGLGADVAVQVQIHALCAGGP